MPLLVPDHILPTPLPWNQRASVLGLLKGDRSYFIEDLARLLRLVGEGVHRDCVIEWPNSQSKITIGHAISPIVNSGLFVRKASHIYLSAAAQEWLESEDIDLLIGILHANVRFVGEILNELCVESMSAVELLEIALEKYGFGWTTGGPIHGRAKWLQAASFISSYSHKFHITEAGRSFLQRLTIHGASSEEATPADLQPAPEVIASLLQKVERKASLRSRAASVYVPGIKSNDGRLASIASLLSECTSATTEDALLSDIATAFETGAAGAERCMRSLILMGLVQRVSPTDLATTPAGRAWVATSYPIDLARIIHANIWYFAEIIKELETAQKLTFSEILNCATKYSHAIGNETIERNGLTLRVALLEALGLISYISNNSYRALPLGSLFWRSVPCIDSLHVVDEEGGLLPLADGTDAGLSPVASATSSAKDVASHSSTQLDAFEATANAIADNLINAGRLSQEPGRLEIAVVSALNFLGLPATHIGGNDGPDGIVRTRPGKLGKILTIEAKSAANGVVPEEQAKQASLAKHRKQQQAESTLYVGPGFEHQLLEILDNDRSVAVLSTSVLAESVRRQAETPLTPEELLPLLDPSLSELERRAPLLERWAGKREWVLVLCGVVDILSQEAESPMSDEEFSSDGIGWLDVASIRRSLRLLLDRAVAREVIVDVLEFLSSRPVEVVEKFATGKEGIQYRLQVPVEAIPRHFNYLGCRWLVGKRVMRDR